LIVSPEKFHNGIHRRGEPGLESSGSVRADNARRTDDFHARISGADSQNHLTGVDGFPREPTDAARPEFHVGLDMRRSGGLNEKLIVA
jgi:hypothetical protein